MNRQYKWYPYFLTLANSMIEEIEAPSMNSGARGSWLSSAINREPLRHFMSHTPNSVRAFETLLL
jgi:hypothetical protein